MSEVISTVRRMKNTTSKRPAARPSLLEASGILTEVTFKDIKTLRLRVLPPDGRVLVSAPHGVGAERVAEFIGSHRDWILQSQTRMRMVTPPLGELVDGGRARLWGRWHEVRVVEGARPTATLADGVITVSAPDPEARQAALDTLHRRELEAVVPGLHDHWSAIVGKAGTRFRYRRMTSRWGSCQPRTGAISLNLALAEWPVEMLEYVLVHELTHLWERGHGARFYALMDRWLPDWRDRRRELKSRAP